MRMVLFHAAIILLLRRVFALLLPPVDITPKSLATLAEEMLMPLCVNPCLIAFAIDMLDATHVDFLLRTFLLEMRLFARSEPALTIMVAR